MATPLVFRCGACGQQNRVAAARLGEGPRCGACKRALPAPVEPLEVDDEGLEGLVAGATLPVVVDFWAPWCGPCRMIGPVLEKLAGDLAGRVIVAKVNVDENPRSAEHYEARAIPLLVGFVGGSPVARQVGALSPQGLRAWVEGVVAKAARGG